MQTSLSLSSIKPKKQKALRTRIILPSVVQNNPKTCIHPTTAWTYVSIPIELVYTTRKRAKFRQDINLGDWNITNKYMDLLYHGTFQKLILCNAIHLSDIGMVCLQTTANLIILNVSGCCNLSPGCINYFPSSIRELNVSSCDWVNDMFLRNLVKKCPLLTIVNLSHCKHITDYGIAAFADMQNIMIEVLDISFCSNITDNGLLAILLKCNTLTELNCTSMHSVEGINLQALPGTGNRLQKLNFSKNSKLEKLTIPKLVRQFAVHLTEVILSRTYEINDESLQALGLYCLQLQSLDISYCAKVTDVGLQMLVMPRVENQERGSQEYLKASKQCKYLNRLILTGCFQITDQGLQYIGKKCQDLYKLKINGLRRVTYSSLSIIAKRCRKLQSLYWNGILIQNPKNSGLPSGFFSIPNVDKKTLSALEQATTQHLHTLHLANTKCDLSGVVSLLRTRGKQFKDLNFCAIVTDELCFAIAQYCFNLQKLRLSRSRYFHENSLLSIFQTQASIELKVLELENCGQITDKSLNCISRNCLRLERLMLSNDWQITDLGVEKIGFACVDLQILTVRRCPEVTYECLHKIVRYNICLQVCDSGLAAKPANQLEYLRYEREMNWSASKIALWLKRCITRKLARIAVEKQLIILRKRKILSAKCIQKCVRRYLFFTSLTQLVKEQRQIRVIRKNWLWDIAVLGIMRFIFIKSWIKSYHKRKFEIRCVLEQEEKQLKKLMVTKIQGLYRGYIGRRRVIKIRQHLDQINKQQDSATLSIQCGFRQYLARQLLKMYRLEYDKKLQQDLAIQRRKEAALKIYHQVLNFFWWKGFRHLVQLAREQKLLRLQSVGIIQRGFRAYMTRVVIHRTIWLGASSIQKLFRGFKGREKARDYILSRAYHIKPVLLILYPRAIYTRIFACDWKVKYDAACQLAIWVQIMYRGAIGRIRYRWRLAVVRQEEFRKNVSANRVQHFFRSALIIKRLADLRVNLHHKIICATKIQSTWRMWLGKIHALATHLQQTRKKRHHELICFIQEAHNDPPVRIRRQLMQIGAIWCIISAYRQSLQERNWCTPTYIKLLNYSATRIQSRYRRLLVQRQVKHYHTLCHSSAKRIQRLWRKIISIRKWIELTKTKQIDNQRKMLEDRAMRVAKKTTSKYSTKALERETIRSKILQSWFKTLKKRHVFDTILQSREAEWRSQANEKLKDALAIRIENAVFQANVWTDAMSKKYSLAHMKAYQLLALEEEIGALKRSCLHNRTEYIRARYEYKLLQERKNQWNNMKNTIPTRTEAIKTSIQPFNRQARILTQKNAEILQSNKQLQRELRLLHQQWVLFQAQVAEVLLYESVLFQDEINNLVQYLNPR